MRYALIIDDNEDVAEVLKIYLEILGFKVKLIENCIRSIKHYKENFNKYDIICIDYCMPKLNGLDLFYKFYKINPKIKAFIHSGKSKPVEMRNKIEGLYGFIQKPFNLDIIKDLIKIMEA
jgi:DNA-binding NtrC family response regulator